MALGKFITFEGGEGVGKSTQIRLLAERLAQNGIDCIQTREPGGSSKAEAVRELLLSGTIADMGIPPSGEAVLFCRSACRPCRYENQACTGARAVGSL